MLKLYCWVTSRMATLRRDNERGAAAVEYGLLVGLIAVAVITAVYWIGSKTNGVFCQVVDALPFGEQDCTAAMP
jgi:pilus assembly protein Flp/PilA